MNFSQLQDRVRVELRRKIERGTLSASLLARQTGIGQPHVSNFLNGRRGLSLHALDEVLSVQDLGVEDLVPARLVRAERPANAEAGGSIQPAQKPESPVVWIPVATHDAAIFQRRIHDTGVLGMEPVQGAWLSELRPVCPLGRRVWERFVAVKVSVEDARAMEPLLGLDAVLIVDRHYTSFKPYDHGGGVLRANLYAVRIGTELRVRFLEVRSKRVVLRPARLGYPLELMEPRAGESSHDLVVGRVVRRSIV